MAQTHMNGDTDAREGARGGRLGATQTPPSGASVFPNEADTLTAHGVNTLPKRDTMPVPPLAPESPASAEALDDADLIDDDLDDDTTTEIEKFTPPEEPTSPTLSLENRSDAARDVYRFFLASDYAPALALANELIAQGETDPMLVAIARECRSSIASEALAPPRAPRDDVSGLAAPGRPIDGKTTLDEVASMTGASVEQILAVLERFVVLNEKVRPRG